MTKMTEFRTGEAGDLENRTIAPSLAQICWKGLDGQPVPDGGYKPPPPHILLQKEALSYLAKLSQRTIAYR